MVKSTAELMIEPHLNGHQVMVQREPFVEGSIIFYDV